MWRSHRRHRWQASSHRIPVHPQEQAGWQAAIAGKTAPTGFRYIRRNRSADRPPSLAGQLPQDSGTSARTGRLSGRHRWQASSQRDSGTSARTGRLPGRHRWQNSSHRIPAHPQEQVGCQAAIPRNGSAPPTTKPRGRALARLALLIMIHPPLREAEWRCSSGEWRAAPFDAVEHAACRSSRSRPEGSVPG